MAVLVLINYNKSIQHGFYLLDPFILEVTDEMLDTRLYLGDKLIYPTYRKDIRAAVSEATFIWDLNLNLLDNAMFTLFHLIEAFAFVLRPD